MPEDVKDKQQRVRWLNSGRREANRLQLKRKANRPPMKKEGKQIPINKKGKEAGRDPKHVLGGM